jgi:anthranilate 1,2-dioxygenase small subunit
MVAADVRHAVERVLFDYADCLDSSRFAEWPAFFDEGGCTYEVLSRENEALGMPLPIMSAYSHGMVTDRVMMLVKETLTWRKMFFRHQIANVRVDAAADDALRVRANFTVHQCDQDGVPSLFMVGRYDAVLAAATLKIRKMAAIVDSFGVDNMMAVPL